MEKQGASLGRQLSIWMGDLSKIAKENPGRVWFMGRDMDVFFVALQESGLDVRYITGLNRVNARKLESRGKLENWLRSIGVKNGDILIDSGYRGSIFCRIAKNTKLDLYFLLLTTDPKGATGSAVSEELNTVQARRVILALEHSPKREVVEWNAESRRPKVSRLGGREGQRANDFLLGCVRALKEAIV